MIHAAALWLNETGFDGMEPPKDHDLPLDSNQMDSSSVNSKAPPPPFTSTIPRNMDPTKINRDRFYLILGISTEALCSPTSTQPDAVVLTCLSAIQKLLERVWPKRQLFRPSPPPTSGTLHSHQHLHQDLSLHAP